MDYHRRTQWGGRWHELGADDPGLLTASAAQRAQLPQPGRPLAAGVAAAPAADAGGAEPISREDYIAEFNRCFQVAPRQRGNAFVPCRSRDLERIFSLQFERSVNRDNTVSFQNLSLQNRAGALAGNVGRLPGGGASAPRWNLKSHPRTPLPGSL